MVSLMPMVVTANFFDIIGPRFAMGGITASEARAKSNPALVVLTHHFWRERLGADPQVLGRALTFNARPFTVIGVLSSDFRSVAGLALSPEVYLPLSPVACIGPGYARRGRARAAGRSVAR